MIRRTVSAADFVPETMALRDAGIIQPFGPAGRSLLRVVLPILRAQAVAPALPYFLHLWDSWQRNRKKTRGREAGRTIMAAYILVASF